MTTIPKKVVERFITQTVRFKRILKDADDRDINEADTVTIITDMLTEIFGFDRYTEITSEYAIRNTYCDLAVKVDDDVKYLIEVKSIDQILKDTHLRQAIDYGAHEGIRYVVLTNGINWHVYNIQLKKTIQYDKVFELDFKEINARNPESQQLLFLLSKEGLSKDVISDYQERIQTINRYIIGAILLNKPALDAIRRDLRKITPGIKIDISEVENIIRNEILKRNVIEDPAATEAQRRVKKILMK